MNRNTDDRVQRMMMMMIVMIMVDIFHLYAMREDYLHDRMNHLNGSTIFPMISIDNDVLGNSYDH